jgi:hypothetical protein
MGPGLGSSPGRREPSGALAHDAVVTEEGPHPTVRVEPTARPGTGVILAGRATSVPFTAVPNGPERTATDNYKASWTCAVHAFHQVTMLPELTLGAGGRVAMALIALQTGPVHRHRDTRPRYPN